jgi:predicted Ser/Thr protein kinase
MSQPSDGPPVPPPNPTVPTAPPDGTGTLSDRELTGVPATLPVPPPPTGSAAALPAVPGFEVLCELGRGGMGVVYKARQRNLNRLVALKMIHPGHVASPEGRARFQREAMAVAQLHHPHIVQIYEVGEVEGRPYFAMEYLEGGNLCSRPKERTHAEIAGLVEQLALAVQHAHDRKIVHRDLKPGNVLLADDGAPRIVDFGLAKHLDATEKLTRSGEVIGTPGYMAPEQVSGGEGKPPIGPATDVYALGAILYELLTGRPPFQSPSVMDVLLQVVSKEPAPPRRLAPQTPRGLETICLKCLEKDPKKRYAGARDLADDLRRFLDGRPLRARPAGVWRRGLRWALRRPLTLLALLVPLPAAALYLGLADAGVSVPGWQPLQDRFDAADASLFRRPYPDRKVRQAAAERRRDALELLKGVRQPGGWVPRGLGNEPKPVFQVWAHSEAVHAVLTTPDATPEERALFVEGLGAPFAPGRTVERDGVKYGWMMDQEDQQLQHPIAEPAVQTAVMLAAALGRRDLLSDEQRRECLARFEYTQEALKAFRPLETGGWNMYPNQDDPGRADTYATVLALTALLEARRSGLPWEGSEARRDELIRSTARWLVNEYDAAASPPGWRGMGGASGPTLDGLTLQIYDVLLLAEDEAGVELPEPMLRRIPRHLAECGARPFGFPDAVTTCTASFTNWDGNKRIGKEPISFVWYPWAVSCAAHWLRRAEKRGAPTLDKVRVRRALGHLVVDLGPEAVARARKEYTFMSTELLWAFSAIPPPE